MFTPKEQEFLARSQAIADSLLEPRAEEVDQGGKVPRAGLDALAEAGLVGCTTPVEFAGGLGFSPAFRQEFTEILAAACGTTWFVLTQHLGSCERFALSGNPTLQRLLPEMIRGRHWVGVGFAHLRRPEPILRAEPTPGGWLLTGVAPWVTGWPILAGAIFGAALPDERHLYVYAPVENSPSMRSSPPLRLCAMGATETTEVRLNAHFIPDDHFLFYSSREQLARGDQNGIASNVAPMLGVARGSLRTLQYLAPRRSLPDIAAAAAALEQEITHCRAECQRWAAAPRDDPGYLSGALAARTWAIDLGVRAGHMAVAATSGAGNLLSHPAQRRFREAMFYTVYQQTGEILAATLNRLSSR